MSAPASDYLGLAAFRNVSPQPSADRTHRELDNAALALLDALPVPYLGYDALQRIAQLGAKLTPEHRAELTGLVESLTSALTR